jgi:hypothetical protein
MVSAWFLKTYAMVVFDPPFQAYAPAQRNGASRRALLIACSGSGLGIRLQGVVRSRKKYFWLVLSYYETRHHSFGEPLP